MIDSPPRKQILYCAVCLKFCRYRAAEDGHVTVFGHRVKITKGDPVCLDHGVMRGRVPILLEAVA